MKKNNIFNARKMIFRLLVLSIFFTSCDDFLEESSPIGLSQSKLTDLPSMSALVNGSYSNMRAFYAYQPMITSSNRVADAICDIVSKAFPLLDKISVFVFLKPWVFYLNKAINDTVLRRHPALNTLL